MLLFIQSFVYSLTYLLIHMFIYSHTLSSTESYFEPSLAHKAIFLLSIGLVAKKQDSAGMENFDKPCLNFADGSEYHIFVLNSSLQ